MTAGNSGAIPKEEQNHGDNICGKLHIKESDKDGKVNNRMVFAL